MTDIEDHDAYIAAAPDELQPLLQKLRQQIAGALPDAEEVMKYNMPGFEAGNTVIVGYAAFSKQCGLYVSKDAIAAHADEIRAAGLKASKTGVTFSPSKPIPGDLVAALVRSSRNNPDG